jgi:hypothetical protein
MGEIQMRFLSVAACALVASTVPAIASTVTSHSSTTYYIEYLRPLEITDDLIFQVTNSHDLPYGGSFSIPEGGWFSFSQTHQYTSSLGSYGYATLYLTPSSGHYMDMSDISMGMWPLNPRPKSFVLEQWSSTSFDCSFMECFGWDAGSSFVNVFPNSDWGRLTTVAPVPEASTWLMLIWGFAAVAFMARRKSAACTALQLHPLRHSHQSSAL